jgi:Zn-finger nucleic acid-binding protein
LHASPLAVTLLAEPPETELVTPVDCPVCGARMAQFLFSPGCKILLDRCTEHGIWLDHGELGDVISYVQATLRDQEQSI